MVLFTAIFVGVTCDSPHKSMFVECSNLNFHKIESNLILRQMAKLKECNIFEIPNRRATRTEMCDSRVLVNIYGVYFTP